MKTFLRRSDALRYTFAILLAGLAAALQFGVHFAFGVGDASEAYEFFLGATALSSILGGRLCALVTLASSMVMRLYFFLPPHNSLHVEHAGEIVRLVLFLAIGTVISLGGGALYASQEAWASTLSSIGDAVVVTDDKMAVRFLNPAAESLTGWANVEAAGRSVHEVLRFVDEESQAPQALPIETTLRNGTVAHLEGASLLVSRAGNRVPIEDNISPIRGASRQPHGAIMVFRDVAEQRRAQNALRESESRYRFLTDTIPEFIMTADGGGQFDYFNQRWYDYTGLSVEQSLGVGWMSALHPDDQTHVAGLWEESARSGEAYELEFRLRGREGNYRWFLARGSPMRDDRGAIQRWLGICADVDDFRRTQEQLHQALKMEAVGRLAGGVAHDFNNLLTVIIGYGEMLSDAAKLAGSPSAPVEQILYAAERASELTRQLLMFSRRQIAEPRVLNLNSVLAETESMLKRLIGEHIDVSTVLDADLLPVKIDRGQIEQVIVNLAVNARDAMPNGGRLTLETANVDLGHAYLQSHLGVAPGRYVMLRVSDTGLGMDDQTLAHIFEPFFTTKGPEKGTGLGLSTVYGIVRQSGGNIWTYSEPGKGTIFKIYLPALLKQDSGPGPATSSQPERLQGTETILVLEDEDAVRRTVTTMLSRNGYTVLEAGTPEEALRRCAEFDGSIHLLLTDVVMPQLSGPQLAERAVRFRPGLRVLFMSGYTGDILDHHRIVDSGAPLLQKPFSIDSLLRKVRDVLDA